MKRLHLLVLLVAISLGACSAPGTAQGPLESNPNGLTPDAQATGPAIDSADGGPAESGEFGDTTDTPGTLGGNGSSDDAAAGDEADSTSGQSTGTSVATQSTGGSAAGGTANQTVTPSDGSTTYGEAVGTAGTGGSTVPDDTTENATGVTAPTSGTSGSTTSTTSGSTSGTNDLLAAAQAQGNLQTLLTAIRTAGLEDTLRDVGPYTIFAPSDQAFQQLPAATLNSLLADPNTLNGVLLYHVVPGRLRSTDILTATSLDTLQGVPLQLSTSGSDVLLNGETRIVTTDIETSNGIIHIIDRVLLPPT